MPAATPAATLEAFVKVVLKQSSHAERAPQELTRLYNEIAAREGEKIITDFEPLYREKIEVQNRALRLLVEEPSLTQRMRIDPRSEELRPFFTRSEDGFAVAKDRFVRGETLDPNTSAQISKMVSEVDPRGSSNLREVSIQLREFANVQPGLRAVTDRITRDMLLIYKKTGEQVLGKTACQTVRNPTSIKNLGEVMSGIAKDVRTRGQLTAKEIDSSLDRNLAKVTGEDLKVVREQRVCPLIKICGVFDGSRATGCIR